MGREKEWQRAGLGSSQARCIFWFQAMSVTAREFQPATGFFSHMVTFYLTMCFWWGKGEFYCLTAPCCTLLYACLSYLLQSCREDLLADQLHHKCLSWRIHSYRVSYGLGLHF